MKLTGTLSLPLLISTAALVVGNANAADSLLLIPALGSDTSNEGRAITADGQFVVGLSGTGSGFLYQVGAANATWVLSSDNMGATIANGVGYRTSGGGTELIIRGMSSGYVTEWMTANGGLSFGAGRRNTSFVNNTMGSANQLGSQLGSDAYFVTSYTSGSNPVDLDKGSGPWVATMTYSAKGIASPDTARMNGVSASGRAVGSRVNGGVRKPYMLTWNGTATPTAGYFNGLNGQTGEAQAVNADGTVVVGYGGSPADPTHNYAWKTMFSGATQGAVNQLPIFGDTGGSTTMSMTYGTSADGRIIVGYDYRGVEKATLWETSDPNPANWFAIDLTDYAAANGLLAGWVRLSRAYSVGLDAAGEFVVTGTGIWSPDGGVTSYTRGFVMTVVPEPAILSLLVVGACGLLMFRRTK